MAQDVKLGLISQTRKGIVSLDVKFATALKEPHIMLLYYEMDASVMLDGSDPSAGITVTCV